MKRLLLGIALDCVTTGAKVEVVVVVVAVEEEEDADDEEAVQDVDAAGDAVSASLDTEPSAA